MRIILCKVCKKPEVKEIVGTLQEMQQIVGGYIEVVPFIDGTFIVCNEEGAYKNLPNNVIYKNGHRETVVKGNCFICRVDHSEFTSVTDEDVKLICGSCTKEAQRETKAIKHLEHYKTKYLFYKGVNNAKEDILDEKDCDLAIKAIKEMVARMASENK